MKKLSLAAVFALTMITSAFAGKDVTPHFKGMENFVKAFPKATGVAYEVKGQFTEVSFTWNDINLLAFYDLDGDLVATSRSISIKDLPLSFNMNIEREYPGYVVTEAIEFDQAENGLSYYVNVVGPEKSYVLHVDIDGTISVFKKMKY
jgi:hypothetical protein